MPVHPGERLRSLPILRIPVRISVDDLGRRPNKVRSVRTAVPEAHAAPPLREVVVAGRALRGRTLDREPGKHLRVTFAPSRCGAAHAALVFLAYQYLFANPFTGSSSMSMPPKFVVRKRNHLDVSPKLHIPKCFATCQTYRACATSGRRHNLFCFGLLKFRWFPLCCNVPSLKSI